LINKATPPHYAPELTSTRINLLFRGKYLENPTSMASHHITSNFGNYNSGIQADKLEVGGDINFHVSEGMLIESLVKSS
jgi:hypothetical protein